MTLKQIITLLKTTGYPVAYDHFPNAVPSVPYIGFRMTGTNNVFSDDHVHKQIAEFELELCTTTKNPAEEKVLTDILDANNICWELVSETYIDDDKVYSLIYNFTEVYEYGESS